MMSNNILKQSHKHTGEPIYVTQKDCAFLLLPLRYRGVSFTNDTLKLKLKHKQLSCASGHTRSFFGRTSDHSTIQTAYSRSLKPIPPTLQNLAMQKLWLDPQKSRPFWAFTSSNPCTLFTMLSAGQFPQDRVEFSKLIAYEVISKTQSPLRNHSYYLL